MDYKIIFAERIKAYRKLRRLSQERLGELAGISYKHLGGIERQEVSPTLDAMAKIAKALEVDLSELLVPPGKEGRVPLESLHKLSTSELNTVREALRILERVFGVSS